MTRFAKFALSAATALSLAAAPVPAVAAPDGEDIAKALAGLAVIGIIAHAARDRDDRSTTGAATWGSIETDRRRDRWDGRGYKRAKLPNRCLRRVDAGRHDRNVYSARCLHQHYRFAHKLPRDCRLRVRTHRGAHAAYGVRCLAHDGWRVARR